jgi:hypothetical protein
MSTTRYSPSMGTFYPHDMNYGSNLPADVIEVALTDYETAMSLAPGYSFAFPDGNLAISAPVPVPFSITAAPFMADVRTTREAILNRLTGIWLAAMASGETDTTKAIAAARLQLLDITSTPQVLAAQLAEDLDALKAAVVAAYKTIVAGVPVEVRNAFDKGSL